MERSSDPPSAAILPESSASIAGLLRTAMTLGCRGWSVASTSGEASVLPADGALAVLLIGLPGSGKSTLAQQLKQVQPQGQWISCHWISTDVIRAQLFGDEAVQGEWFQVQDEVERQLRQTARQNGMAGKVIAIYDATHAISGHRRAAIVLARAAGFSTVAGLWLDVALDRCLEWNRRRDRKVPNAAILQMHHQLCNAPPHLNDGFDCLVQIRPASDAWRDGFHRSGPDDRKSG